MTSPLRNESSAAVRADWSMSPCSAAGVEAVAHAASGAARRLRASRLQKMMAFLRSVGRADQLAQRLALVMRLAAGLDQQLRGGWRPWLRVARPRRAPDCAGTASVMRWISGGMVAVKNSVWRVNGTSLQMRSMSGMKPMSSMRSASSMTRSSTPVSSSRAALEMVEQPAGRGDQHVDAAQSAWRPDRRTTRRR